MCMNQGRASPRLSADPNITNLVLCGPNSAIVISMCAPVCMSISSVPNTPTDNNPPFPFLGSRVVHSQISSLGLFFCLVENRRGKPKEVMGGGSRGDQWAPCATSAHLLLEADHLTSSQVCTSPESTLVERNTWTHRFFTASGGSV